MYKQYRNEISNEEYRISLKDFQEWIEEKNLMETLKQEAEEDIYKAAVDFSVMVIVIKAMMK